MAVPMLIPVLLRAHHSIAPFDMTKDFTVTGKVTEFRWGNPHTYVYIEAPSDHDPGKTQRWTLEMDAANLLRRYGWTKQTLQPGDQFTCHGARAKLADVFAVKCFNAELEDGTKMIATPVAPPPAQQGPRLPRKGDQ